MNASAIILAAGSGTRMKSKKPKVAHELLGKPLVKWVVDSARKAEVKKLVTVVGHGRDQVIPLVEHDASVIVQQNLRGTADAVLECKEEFADYEGSLLVLSGDSPLITPETLKALITKREKEQAAVVVLTMKPANPFGYGRIVRDEDGNVERIVEQKDCTAEEAQINECNSGFYCFDAQALFTALDQVGNQNAQGEYYLTDVLEICRNEGRPVVALQTSHPEECLGINSRGQLAQATAHAQRRINDQLMAEGVTMTDPTLVWVGPDVEVASDVEILPMTFLYGKCSIGQDSVVGPNARLTDTHVGEGCVVDETISIEAQIDDGATSGPRAYLRPGTHLCTNAKAGTHVEIKNSEVGEGSKVPHLSYIGDATIGKNANVGAGSITCNYDGVKKHHTTIGDEAFIGSDTMMVAPVEIGAHAVIGAGSTITKNVSEGALGIERSKQTEISDWHKRKHGN